MSFASTFTPISEAPEIAAEQFPVIISSIQQKISIIKSSVSSIQLMSREKRIEIHEHMKSANQLANKMQKSLLKLNTPGTKDMYTKWKKKLEQELVEVTKYARQLIKAEEYLQETKEVHEEDALLGPQQQILEFELEMHSDILKEREEKINKITTTIYTVNTMLKDLGEMVCEQGFLIDNIESNIEDSTIKSKNAVTELAKSDRDSKSGKQRHCLIVLLVALFLLIFTIIGTSYYRRIPEKD